MSVSITTGSPQRGPSGLVVAFLVALALHGLALLGIAYLRLNPPAPTGENTITIDLAPQMTEAQPDSVAEQQAMLQTPPEAEPVEKPEEAEPVKPPETAEVVPEEQVAEKPPETEAVKPPEARAEVVPEAQPIEPESQVITSTAEQAEPLAPPPPAVAEPAKPVEPEKPKVDLAKLKAEREAKLKAIREAKRREELQEQRREEVREAKLKAARERAKAEAARQGAERATAAASRQASSGRASAGNDPSAMRQWQGMLSSAIHGRMNRNAALGTAGGVATVRFTVARSGQVTSAGLASSSGVGQIDSAALAAVRGSLPAAPPGVTLSSLSVTIPLRFTVAR